MNYHANAFRWGADAFKEKNMLEKIDHIGIAVRNLDEATAFYKTMGAEPYHYEEVESQKS